ncbi:MAG: hypothetical protein HY904_26150 [Deltaproteobacteria bacterium]|nr:hypothetical protein [Deltaproteobacteria bacterium]
MDASARHFRIRADDGTDDAVVCAAVPGRSVLIGDNDARTQQAAWDRGEPTFTRETLAGLSLLEARVLAVRLASVAAAAAPLDEATRHALEEHVRFTLLTRLLEVHADGGRPDTGWFFLEWPTLAARALARADLPPPAAAAIRAVWLTALASA